MKKYLFILFSLATLIALSDGGAFFSTPSPWKKTLTKAYLQRYFDTVNVSGRDIFIGDSALWAIDYEADLVSDSALIIDTTTLPTFSATAIYYPDQDSALNIRYNDGKKFSFNYRTGDLIPSGDGDHWFLTYLTDSTIRQQCGEQGAQIDSVILIVKGSGSFPITASGDSLGFIFALDTTNLQMGLPFLPGLCTFTGSYGVGTWNFRAGFQLGQYFPNPNIGASGLVVRWHGQEDDTTQFPLVFSLDQVNILVTYTCPAQDTQFLFLDNNGQLVGGSPAGRPIPSPDWSVGEGEPGYIYNKPDFLFSQLGDVDFSGLASGQVPMYTSGTWENAELGLSNLSDVDVSSITGGYVLKHNGSEWAPAPDEEGIPQESLDDSIDVVRALIDGISIPIAGNGLTQDGNTIRLGGQTKQNVLFEGGGPGINQFAVGGSDDTMGFEHVYIKAWNQLQILSKKTATITAQGVDPANWFCGGGSLIIDTTFGAQLDAPYIEITTSSGEPSHFDLYLQMDSTTLKVGEFLSSQLNDCGIGYQNNLTEFFGLDAKNKNIAFQFLQDSPLSDTGRFTLENLITRPGATLVGMSGDNLVKTSYVPQTAALADETNLTIDFTTYIMDFGSSGSGSSTNELPDISTVPHGTTFKIRRIDNNASFTTDIVRFTGSSDNIIETDNTSNTGVPISHGATNNYIEITAFKNGVNGYGGSTQWVVMTRH